MFLSREVIEDCGWAAFERLIARLLIHRGFSGVRVVGGSGDRGADIIAVDPNNRRWLVQAKYWDRQVPESELQRTVEAARAYRAATAVLVARLGVDSKARAFQRTILAQGQSLSVWDTSDLVELTAKLKPDSVPLHERPYQEAAIEVIHEMLATGAPRRAMVVMATGLGKTSTAAEAIRRCQTTRPIRVLVLAHTNQLVLQLERAFWKFIGPVEPTVVWNQHEKPSVESLTRCRFVFASRDSVANYLDNGGELPQLDLVLIDECHHAHSNSTAYSSIIKKLSAGTDRGPQLLGLTATPFLASSDATLEPVFGAPLVAIDMIYGLRHGFLSQVDYRLFTDNINWEALHELTGRRLTPSAVNRLFFIREWDDGVIGQIQSVWSEVAAPKAIIFCGTIEHALLMRDKINSRGFCKAEAMYSGVARGSSMNQYDRNLILADFESGDINVICAVDVFNEGLDVPDVNVVVFNRVTHSRRIFIQQLGRGLRLAPGKSKAIVLDFAQDIRRYAAGMRMKAELDRPEVGSTITLGNRVVFRNAAGEDKRAESFLNAWLKDVEEIEAMQDEGAGTLQFPPSLG